MNEQVGRRFWLGVVSASHVRRAVSLGIAQINHGERAGLARMSVGDGLIYYSAQTDFPRGAALRAFTAVGTVADDEIWQADEGEFKPYRRRVNYRAAHDVPLADLRDALDLTGERNWGYQLRRGLIPLSGNDYTLISTEMTAAVGDRG